MTPGALAFVVPRGFRDPGRASGGNVFDRRVADGLASLGWSVRLLEVEPRSASDLGSVLSTLDASAPVLIDGLVAGRAAVAIEAASQRLRIVILAHMVSAAFPDANPVAVAGERRALRAASGVIVTSEWTRAELIEREGIPAERVVVATPGADDAPAARGTRSGKGMLCVGVVAPHKGQDVLVEALAALDAHDEWTCTIAGSLDTWPEYAEQVVALAAGAGLQDRLTMAGVLSPHELDDAYAHADLVVAPSRVESYGMAIADALRRGIPVVASRVGGIPQAVAPSGAAMLVPPGEPGALRDALRQWMIDTGLRDRLKHDALHSRSRLPRWSDTAQQIATTLEGMAWPP